MTDRLIDYLGSRLADLRRLADVFEDVEDISTALSAQHRVARRLAELWGEGFGEADEAAQIKGLASALRDRRRRFRGLQDSHLYKAVPRRAKIDGRLRATNVLTNHQHYRRVAALWRALEKTGTSIATKRHEHDAWQRRMRSFDAFCVLLVCAAVERLGFAAPAGSRIELARPGRIALSGPLGDLELEWAPMSGASIHGPGGAMARFVPLAASLSGVDEGASDANARRAAARVKELTGLAVAQPTVVLYPGTRRQRAAFDPALSRAFIPDDAGLPARGAASRPALVPVSPLDIFSLERVERVVRRVVLVTLLGQFPPTVPCKRIVRDRLGRMAGWLEVGDSLDCLAVIEPPDEPRLARLTDRIDAAKGELRPREDDAIRDALDAFARSVGGTRSYFDRVRQCPVCKGQGAFRRRGAAHFVVSCGSCESSWGLAACGGCGARVPYLRTAGDPLGHAESDAPGSLDRVHGRDVLATPCLRAASDAYVCPACRTCPGATEPCGPSCPRAA